MECYVFDDILDYCESSYLVKTANSEAQKKIISTVFRGGKLVFSRAQIYNGSLTENQLLEKVQGFHDRSKTDMEALFKFSNRYRNSRDIGKRVLLVRALMKNRLYDEAQAEIESLQEINPNLSALHFYGGRICCNLGNFADAVRHFKKAISLKSSYADYHFFLGRAYFETEQYRNAIEELTVAIELNAYYYDACFYLGLAHLRNAICKEDYDLAKNVIPAAREQFLRASQIYPNFKNAAFEEGLDRLKIGDIEAAFDRLLTVLDAQRTTLDHEFILDFHVKYLSDEGSVSIAEIERHIARLQELVRRFSNYADLHHELGIAYLILSKSVTQKAMTSFRNAVSVNPHYTSAQRRLKHIASNRSKSI